MKLLDVVALTPDGISPSDWAPVLAEVHGADWAPILPSERIPWLKRLSEEEVWGEVQLLTSRAAWPFWRLSSERVEMLDEAGKKLPKAMRTKALDEWAAALAIGSTKKADVTRALKLLEKAQGPVDEYDELCRDYNYSASNKAELYTTDGDYQLVDDIEFYTVFSIMQHRARQGDWWCWDSETDSAGEEDSEARNPFTDELVSVQIGFGAKQAYMFPIGMRDPQGKWLESNLDKQKVLTLLSNLYTATWLYTKEHPDQDPRRVLLHNCKYDYSVMGNPLQQVPIDEIYSLWLPLTHDTMLMASIANEPRAGLKPLTKAKLGIEPLDYDKLTNGGPFSLVPLEHAVVYGGQDADWPLRLFDPLKKSLEELKVSHVYERELNLVEYFMRMERRGFPLDLERLAEIEQDCLATMDISMRLFITVMQSEGIEITPTQYKISNGDIVPGTFNMASHIQMAKLLFSPKPHGLGLPVLLRTDTGGPATGKKALNRLKATGITHRALNCYQQWVKAKKRLDASVTPLKLWRQSDGRVRGNYHQVGAATGRTSMDKPNGQQLDYIIRTAVRAEEGGELAGLDYSQVELRALAAEFHESKMLEVFNLPRKIQDEDGKWVENPAADIHSKTMYEMKLDRHFPNKKEARTKAKNFNFGKAFLGGPQAISDVAGISMEEAVRFDREYDKAYPERTKNIELRIERDFEAGVTRNWFGRARVLKPPTNGRELDRNRKFVANTPVQGGALDVIKWAMLESLPLIREVEQYGIHPWNMVHDELDFEYDGSQGGKSQDRKKIWREMFLPEIQKIMERCNPWKDLVPLFTDLEVGTTWANLRAMDDEVITAPELEEASV